MHVHMHEHIHVHDRVDDEHGRVNEPERVNGYESRLVGNGDVQVVQVVYGNARPRSRLHARTASFPLPFFVLSR